MSLKQLSDTTAGFSVDLAIAVPYALIKGAKNVGNANKAYDDSFINNTGKIKNSATNVVSNQQGAVGDLGNGATSTAKNVAGKTKADTPRGTSAVENGNYFVYDNRSPMTGTDWNNYFINKYNQKNVRWKLNSIEDIWSSPTRMVGYSEKEMKSVLGDGWMKGAYGSKGDGWKYMKDDISVFYHPTGGKHGGAYYVISSGATGKIKVVNPNTYIPLPGDKATIIFH
ncbi:MAG: hypothetical protein K5978_07170 [Campylobacter sp.]|nr:hypothetical protein [Campylobacter sp.]